MFYTFDEPINPSIIKHRAFYVETLFDIGQVVFLSTTAKAVSPASAEALKPIMVDQVAFARSSLESLAIDYR